MAILIKKIPNMKAPLDNTEREIHINGIVISDKTKEIHIPYEIKFFKDGVDVSADMNQNAKPFNINNEKTVYVRDTSFNLIEDPVYTQMLANFENEEPEFISNPDFVSVEETPDIPEQIPNPNYVTQEMIDNKERYLLMPGYDYLIQLYKTHPEYIWISLEAYILENWNDGWFDNR